MLEVFFSLEKALKDKTIQKSEMSYLRKTFKKCIREGDLSIADAVLKAIVNMDLVGQIVDEICEDLDEEDMLLYKIFSRLGTNVDVSGIDDFLWCTVVSEQPVDDERHQYCSCCDHSTNYQKEARFLVKNPDENETFTVDLEYTWTGTPGCCGVQQYRIVRSCC